MDDRKSSRAGGVARFPGMDVVHGRVFALKPGRRDTAPSGGDENKCRRLEDMIRFSRSLPNTRWASVVDFHRQYAADPARFRGADDLLEIVRDASLVDKIRSKIGNRNT